MSLWVRRATGEAARTSRFLETLNRVVPMPFEERRSRVGQLQFRTWRWIRLLPFLVVPTLVVGTVFESRSMPHENALTPLHLWLADHGVFRHDSVKALNPSFEDERRLLESKMNDRKWRSTGVDLLSEREVKEFAAISLQRKRLV